jgi:hypothetical protein
VLDTDFSKLIDVICNIKIHLHLDDTRLDLQTAELFNCFKLRRGHFDLR